MKKVIFISMFLVAFSISASAQTTVWQNGFESGWTNWSTDNGVWQIGNATAGPGACYAGTQCAGTVLDGNYPQDTDSRLISFHMVLPTVSGSEELHLQFRNWFSYSLADGGQAQVAVWNGSSWGGWENVGMPAVGESGEWFLKDVDLSAYAGQTIRLAFYHIAAPCCESTGWYIDDIKIVVKTPQFTGDFETGWGDWSAENGVWQVGTPTAGPGACHEGSQCAGTVLVDDYPAETDSRLISATMGLPAVTGSEELHLRFWNWFSYGLADGGQVQVAAWNGSNWESWVDVGITVLGVSGGWFIKDVDLTAYAGQTIRLAFNHIAAPCCESSGWYIDDIRIVVKTPQFSGDFEAGWGDWSAENGVWQIGTPTAGPEACHEGSQCAGTMLDGNYPESTDSRLISATTVLPAVTGSEELHLRFWNWFSYGLADGGQVQVAVWNGSSWGDWVNEGIPVVGLSGDWFIKDVDLTAYAGQTIRLAFYHMAAPCCESTGWYIDDIKIVVKTPQFTGDFEMGWGDWIAENGVWQVGVPTAGPTACYEGEQCAGTVLNGNYLPDTDSRMISAPITLPIGTGPEGVWLRFQTWFSYGLADAGQVQVSVWNEGSWGNWANVGSPVSSVSGGWSLIHIDLTAYSGERVRLAFYHSAAPCCESTGWYIDDLHITGDDDNDGVGNWTDLCPGTPEGVSVDAHGCSACQNNPTLAGCPAADDDGDGVLNELDECPGTPPGASVNAKGCSAQFQVQILDVDTTECPAIQARLIVTDINGSVISNLTKANFEAYVGDTLQSPITVQYVDQTTFPVAASLALDYSGSMGAAAISDMENAAEEFINQLTNGDTGEVIKFANGIETARSFTSDKASLLAAVNAHTGLDTSRTKFYDSVYQAIADTSLQSGRKAVIAMTDGQDNASGHSAAAVISHAKSNGVPVFTIGLGKSVNAGILRSIAEQTGGLYYESPDSSDLESIYRSISTVLKNQYILTFDSSYRDGRSHQLTIMAIDGALFGSDEETFTVCLDSDNDGLIDEVEAGSSTNPNDADTDDDGILDGMEDADHDGVLDAGESDPRNADSDRDGIQDGTEIGRTSADIGPGTDPGFFIPDADPSTTTNPLDNDSDDDGILDGEEDANHNGKRDAGETDPNASLSGAPFGDFDGDGHADITVWRPNAGVWFIIPNTSPGSYTSIQWGTVSDIPVPGDYDGDARSDIAVRRPGTGVWYALPSNSPGTYTATQWGVSSDIPVLEDYDGDGMDDIAVWRPGTGTWFILPSASPGTYTATQWGAGSDVPVPADYDGDGTADIAVWRLASGVWYILPSNSPGTYTATQWGMAGDIPVPGNYDGDKRTDLAVWRPTDGVWYVLPSATPNSYTATAWGATGDKPVPGDYDGDGKTDPSVWRPNNGIWYILMSGTPGSYVARQWGMEGDMPISATACILHLLP
jgi:VWFA-related protein